MQPLGRHRTKPARPISALIDLEAEAGGQQHAERGHHPHQPALGVGGLEHDHGQPDIGAVFRGHALDQRALLGFGAGRRVAADLPILVHRFDRALGKGLTGTGKRQRRHQREEDRPLSVPENAHRSIPWRAAHCRLPRLNAGESPPVWHFIRLGWVMPGLSCQARAKSAGCGWGPSKPPSRGVNTAPGRARRRSCLSQEHRRKVHCGRNGIVVLRGKGFPPVPPHDSQSCHARGNQPCSAGRAEHHR